MIALNAAQMQAVDQETIKGLGLPGVVLMENAGRAVAEVVAERFADKRGKGALVLAGKGNNGGDGLVTARHLIALGWPVKIVVFAKRGDIKGDAAINMAVLEKCGGSITFTEDSLELSLLKLSIPGVLVDSLFGTGLSKSLRGLYAEAVDWINRLHVPVVAVDMPSGIDASNGQILGQAVRATITVTFAFPKIGQITSPGAEYVGELTIVDIGIPTIVSSRAKHYCLGVNGAQARQWLPHRPDSGHKGTFGHLIVLAGSIGKTGAAIMTAESGLRGGCGLVTLACPQSIYPIVASQLTEVMGMPLDDLNGEASMLALDDINKLLESKSALALGPGLGLGEEAGTLVRRLVLDCPLPTVVDADGLTHLTGHCDILKRRQGPPVVLTPHPGEMSRLTGMTIDDIQANRVDAAREFASKYGVVLVLKGFRTITACPSGKIYVNLSGHVGLASGGMGDVLTGLIGSLLAQGLVPELASALATYLHGSAADNLREKYGVSGLLASDIMQELPLARQALHQGVF